MKFGYNRIIFKTKTSVFLIQNLNEAKISKIAPVLMLLNLTIQNIYQQME